MKKTKERKEKMLKQKGITLIALVITIIVMLILVAVTVSYTIQSGLLGKAQEAKIRQEEEKEKEILGNAYAEYLVEKETGKLGTKTFDNFLPQGWKNSGNGKYKSPNGNVFTVTNDGKITVAKVDEEQTEDNVPEELRKYFLGEDGNGKLIVSGIRDEETWDLIGDSNIENPNEVLELVDSQFLGDDGVYAIYNNSFYLVTMEYNGDDNNITTGINYLWDGTEGKTVNVGKTATYKGVNYVILSEKDGYIEMISKDVIGEDEIEIEVPQNQTGAINLYNTIVSTLDTKCINELGLEVDGTKIKSIRSLGNSGKPESTAVYEKTIGTYNNTALVENNNFIEDELKLIRAGINFEVNSQKGYWFAKRAIDFDTKDGFLDLDVYQYAGYKDEMNRSFICKFSTTNEVSYGYDLKSYLRPVVTIKADAQGLEIGD